MTRRAVLIAPFALPIALLAKDKRRRSANIDVDIVFGPQDRRIIREWVHAQPASGLPPGLAKRDRLPPGLEKQLRRKGSLPPGLEKKLTPFPADLDARLPPIGPDYERVFVNGRAAIVARIGQVVLDIFVP
ncbi:MAG: hypothetical protein R2748_32455 [Bryobacterales bacterium]